MKKTLTILTLIITISLALVPANAQSTTVQVTPASYTVPDVDLSFNVNVTITDVQDLYGYAFTMYYPNDILNGTSATEGPFLKSGGFQTAFFKPDFSDNYNATNGRLLVACTRVGNVTGASGTGTLVTITFKARGASANMSKPLNLADVDLSDPNATAILPLTVVDGEVTVLPEFSTTLILPLLMALSLFVIALAKKRITIE